MSLSSSRPGLSIIVTYRREEALHELPDFYPERLKKYKQMLQNGYKPVIMRAPMAGDSPVMQLIRQLEPKVRGW